MIGTIGAFYGVCCLVERIKKQRASHRPSRVGVFQQGHFFRHGARHREFAKAIPQPGELFQQSNPFNIRRRLLKILFQFADLRRLTLGQVLFGLFDQRLHRGGFSRQGTGAFGCPLCVRFGVETKIKSRKEGYCCNNQRVLGFGHRSINLRLHRPAKRVHSFSLVP